MKKIRLDQTLIERELEESIERARALIMAGEVWVKGNKEYKPSFMVKPEWKVEIKPSRLFVSRGALKIAKPFKEFCIDLKDKKILDIGISTGGFSDYVLKNGASHVTGVDVNTDQVDFNLKKDPRLKLIKKNARTIKYEDIGFMPDLIIMDLSFISILKILPTLAQFRDSQILSLIKPQFEAEKHMVEKGGIIRSEKTRLKILLDLKSGIEELGFSILKFTKAGLKGQKGNQEYFFLMEHGSVSEVIEEDIKNEI